MTDISKATRQQLSDHFSLDIGTVKEKLVSKDGTKKWLLNFGGKADVETVFIPMAASDDGHITGTVCVSSQVGCTLACSFCHTGTQKLLRNLTASEILGQLMHVLHDVGDFPVLKKKPKPRTVTNIGQGEPLLNPTAVFSAISTMTSPKALGLAPWRVTVSTSGVAPTIERISKELRAGLAISLHAVTDELRNELVPLNKQYPIAAVLQACRDYLSHISHENRHRRITFEYVMLKGVNDSLKDAKQLTRLIDQFPAHVNLIPFNPWPGSKYECSTSEAVEAFWKEVRRAGIECTVRTPRGQDIMAACGQLKSSTDMKVAASAI
ncbi:hypothetical protein HK097_007388 [Rhizophlyctis rosea]|uniref:Radical SAM core domain-containing protein n=1 Tax=Rhizophlyctis rosea TaxID=64517 RepID=A0AAD5SBP9_9FUNG|nr:hypothetical protein HK097_007388 [Rhizophlyctis rosea]